ncbi:enhancer of polycomb homolog 1-like [Tubulanus polymorphus]|uniref:enhancer of polycomb homolog 1-like n=1 Tax=Tubulanus polymorphus TaxID=672921 RepID=UPI003DA3EC7F
MSKLSFRARALDSNKPMPIYKSAEIPDLPDFAAINRAVPQMPTGMEKEEETEHHLQRALSAQQVYGTAEALVIPIPEIAETSRVSSDLYADDFKQPKQFIHVQAFGMEQEIPDYDMDSEDEVWVGKQSKKMEIKALQFEEMMDRLEKGSGQQVVTLQEAKLLLKQDDDLIIAVYDYWLNKRLRTQQPLIPSVKTEKRDGSTTNNPYVAFRRRTEKMQTRKNRKNDEVSYEKMLKLRRDLSRAVTLLEMIKRREKSKKELLQLTIEVFDTRYQQKDWDGKLLQEALAKRDKMPSFLQAIQTQYALSREWTSREDTTSYTHRKKREYKKRKHKHTTQSVSSTTQLPQYQEVDVLHTDVYSSDDEPLSPAMSPSDHEDENDPDGIYAFKRKKGCSYLAPVTGRQGNWPWYSRDSGGLGDKRYRFTLASLPGSRCIGYARRRVGRGGRIIIDRQSTPWDDELHDLDLYNNCKYSTGESTELSNYLKDNKWLHYRPRTPPDDLDDDLTVRPLSPPITPDYSVFEQYRTHQEQLYEMKREQEDQILRYETSDIDSSIDLEHSFSSQPTSRFTLDSASAQFAASAVINQQLLLQTTSVTTTTTTTAASSSSLLSSSFSSSSTPSLSLGANTIISGALLSNGTDLDCNKNSAFSTSPAATVLQLNYPPPSTGANNNNTLISSSSSSSSQQQSSSSSVLSSTSSSLKLAVSTPSTHVDPLLESTAAMVSIMKDSPVPMEVT